MKGVTPIILRHCTLTKRTLPIALALALLLLAALPLSASAGTAAQTAITLTAKTSTVLHTGDASDAFRVAVGLSLGKDEEGLSAYVVTVRWDPSVLELCVPPESVTQSGCYFDDYFREGWKFLSNEGGKAFIYPDASKGKLTVVFAHKDNFATSDGILFLLNFRPKKGGVTTEITVTPGSSNVAPGAALSSASGRITNVAAESKLPITIKAASARRGDLNASGDINALDYMLLKRHVLGTFKLTSEQQLLGDINRDGALNALDYMLLKRHVLGTYVIP